MQSNSEFINFYQDQQNQHEFQEFLMKQLSSMSNPQPEIVEISPSEDDGSVHDDRVWTEEQVSEKFIIWRQIGQAIAPVSWEARQR